MFKYHYRYSKYYQDHYKTSKEKEIQMMIKWHFHFILNIQHFYIFN